ncbi:MAG: flagellar basal body L-ring protein FlgH [Pseudomonadales bacterium]|nr:flagellar basal body L-ring protein FlgH [Pseudomonadales bacterium]
MKNIQISNRVYPGLVALLIVLLSGCVTISEESPDDPAYAPVALEKLIPPPAQGGSLFQDNFGISLYDDHKAYRIGDIITVTLNENTASSKTADTKVERESETTLVDPVLLGQSMTGWGRNFGFGLNSENDFEGKAGSDQSNSLVGSITVTVVNVLPNGVLKIRGEKWIALNQGEEYIRISGMIRTEDISSNNEVSSMRVADARISYGGVGALADANSQGWLGRFFNSKWWPW